MAKFVPVPVMRCDDSWMSEQPGMNENCEFRAGKRRRLHEPHIQPLTALIERWRQEGRPVPWADPDSGGIHSKILFLLESPGPAASDEHGSGFISSDNADPTARLFW